MDRDVARRLIVYLEDRRLLYVSMESEAWNYCIRSVIDIRAHISELLMQVGLSNELCDTLRAIRASCRKFIESFESSREDAVYHSTTVDIVGMGHDKLAEVLRDIGTEQYRLLPGESREAAILNQALGE